MTDISSRIASLSGDKLRLLLREAGRRGSASTGIEPYDRSSGPLPLSFAQRRLWFFDQLEPGSHLYNEPLAVRLDGPLDVRALARSLGEIVRRHEVLRTTFVSVEDEPVQSVAPSLDMPLPVVDLGALPESARSCEAVRLARAEGGRGFDLMRGPLVRARLLRLAPHEHVLLLTMHHIVSDAWSLGVLMRELGALYPAFARGVEPELPEPRLQYADFAAWQQEWIRGGGFDEQLDYWKRQLAGAPEVLDLPTDAPREGVRVLRGGILPFELSPELTAALRELCRSEGVTIFNVLLAAFQTLLFSYTGQDDVVVGADVANRNRRETEGMMGFFVNMLVLRTDLSGDPTFRELLARVREMTLEAYARQDVPFDRLVEELRPPRDSGRSPLFQVVFNYYAAEARIEVPGLSVTPLAPEGGAVRFELSLFVIEEGGKLAGSWRYSADLFRPERIARMNEHYQALLRRVAAQPDVRLSNVEILSPAEKSERMETKKELKAAGLKRFMKASPKAVARTQEGLVRTGRLCDAGDGAALPLVLEPGVEEVDLVGWVGGNRGLVLSQLSEHGGLLFRGFKVDGVAGFERFARAVCPDLLNYSEPSSPRSEVGANVYTSTEYPASQWIQLHNEMSYAHNWPAKVFFYCAQPAEEGGETPIADSRRVYELLDPALRRRFAEKNVMYVRNFGEGLDLSWQHVFGTTERGRVEEYCRGAGIEFEWRDGGRLRTRQVRQAVARHPQTGEVVWFNQAHAFHASTLEPQVRESLFAELGEENIPRNAFYGDGSPIEDSAVEEIRRAYAAASVTFPWREGDILLLDNVAVAHGRAPFKGARRVLVAMSELLSDASLNLPQVSIQRPSAAPGVSHASHN